MTSIGWNVENFARTKRLKPIEDYLKKQKPVELEREERAHDVGRMFDRMIERAKEEEEDSDGVR